MNGIRRLMVAAAGAMVLAACGQPGGQAAKVDPAADQAAVRAVNEAWFKAFAAGDAAGVTATYASDAVVNPPGAPAVRGAEAIQAYFTNEIAAIQAAGLSNVSDPAGNEVGVSGDLAWQTGRYTVSAKDGSVVETGKYTSVFARRDGGWKMIRDTWNADAPAVVSGTALRIVRFTAGSAEKQKAVTQLVDDEVDALYKQAKGLKWVQYYVDPKTLETGSVSLWDSAADVDAFLQSEGYKPIPGKLKPLMKGPMVSNVFELHSPPAK